MVQISVITNGYVFTSYEKESKKDVFLFFEKDDTTPLGAFWWCEPGSRNKTQSCASRSLANHKCTWASSMQ
jgi:hypothetical protein